MAKLSQNEMVLDWLRCRPITQLDALKEFGCMRLASRISDLRRQGHIITSENKEHINRYGRKINYSEYRLVKEADNGSKAD